MFFAAPLLFPTVLRADPPLEIRATELKTALPIIASRYRVALRVAPAIADEILIARLTDAPFEEVEAQIAREFAARWEVAPDGTQTLVPDPKAIAQERNVSIGDRRQRIGVARAEMVAELETYPALTAADGEAYRTEMKAREDAARIGRERPPIKTPVSPSRRLAIRLLTSLSAEQIAGDDPDSRDVFSTSPTPLQRPLPPNVGRAVQEYVRERALFADPSEAPPAPIGTATVYVFRSPEFIFVRARLFDANGAQIESTPRAILPYRNPEDLKLPSGIAFDFVPDLATIEADRLFAASTRFPFGQVRSILMREPLGFGVSDVLLSAARVSDRNLVCHPMDEAYRSGVGTGKGDLAPWLRPGTWGSAARDGERWLRVSTGDAWIGRRAFVPRSRLYKLVEAFGGRKPSLLDQIALAPSLPERGFGATAEDFVFMASANAPLTNFPVVKLYASMTPTERTAAKRGVRIGSLNADALARVRDLVFGYGVLLNRFGDRSDLAPESGWDEPTTLFGASPQTGGIEWNDGVLTLDDAPETIIRVPREGEYQDYDADSIAGLVTDPTAAARYGFDLSRMSLTTRERAAFHVRWTAPRPGTWGADWTLPGATGPVDPGPYNVTTLPAPIRIAVEAAIERRRASRDENGSGAAPPP